MLQMTSCPAACTALVYLTKFSIACSAPYLFRLCRSYCGQALQEFCVINLISNWAEGEEAQQPRRSSAFLPRDLLHLPGLQQCVKWEGETRCTTAHPRIAGRVRLECSFGRCATWLVCNVSCVFFVLYLNYAVISVHSLSTQQGTPWCAKCDGVQDSAQIAVQCVRWHAPECSRPPAVSFVPRPSGRRNHYYHRPTKSAPYHTIPNHIIPPKVHQAPGRAVCATRERAGLSGPACVLQLACPAAL